jgi:aryl-alcohol dehydrogenase-like predicted oxidoreductase
METRPLGNSDLRITPVGFGAWAVGGGGWAFGWGPQDDDVSVACIREAVGLGINWIDTAAVYGLGHSEEVVARALDGMADRPLVFTKCGRVWGDDRQIGKSLAKDSVRRECENSLRRLKVDVIDLYQMHWPEPDEEVEEGWQTMLDLKAEGKVRWVGVSNFDVPQLQRAAALGPVTSLQPPYSLLRRDVEAEVLPHCREQGIGVIAYSPMASGLLTGGWSQERRDALPADDWRREKNRLFQEPQFGRGLRVADGLRAVGRPHGLPPGAVAVSWVLGHPAVTGAIVGARAPGQLKELVGSANFRLSDDDAVRVEDLLVG